MKTQLSLLLTGLITALLAAGCGGDDPQNGTGDAPAGTQSSSGASSDSNADAREVVIEANDQMQFNIKSFDVQAGEQIHLVLKNVGTMPKFSMGHNVVILKQGTDPEAFVEASMNAAGSDYIAPDREGDILAHTKLIGGGEEDSITFTAPEETGEYEFLCSFPGHFQIGMRGTMNVQ